MFECSDRKGFSVSVSQAGNVWTWTALEASGKLLVSFMVGDRDGEYALALIGTSHVYSVKQSFSFKAA